MQEVNPPIQLAITKSNKVLYLQAFAALKSDQFELYFDVFNFSVALVFRILTKSR